MRPARAAISKAARCRYFGLSPILPPISNIAVFMYFDGPKVAIFLIFGKIIRILEMARVPLNRLFIRRPLPGITN
jgi:hypothetical protein